MTDTESTKTIWPSLAYADARAAIRFLVDTFGFEPRIVIPEGDGAVEHSELRWPEGGGVMVSTAGGGDDDRLGEQVAAAVGHRDERGHRGDELERLAPARDLEALQNAAARVAGRERHRELPRQPRDGADGARDRAAAVDAACLAGDGRRCSWCVPAAPAACWQAASARASTTGANGRVRMHLDYRHRARTRPRLRCRGTCRSSRSCPRRHGC
jgi:uncharacterized glyoxalase superfamily protein PhnB